MAKEAMRKPITYRTAIMLAVIVVLAGGFVYDYASMSSQVSTVCQQNYSIVVSQVTIISNLTITLHNQIQTDNSLIQTLNSTRPSGYTGMIAALKNETAQDSALFTYIQHEVMLHTTTLPPPNPCS